MSDSMPYAHLLLIVSGVGLGALLTSRIANVVRVPAPLLMLVAAAVTAQIFPATHHLERQTVDRLVVLALIFILFDGGAQIGWSKLKPMLSPILLVAVIGTFLTAAIAASLLVTVVGLQWYPALLIAAAVAPTDPAVVFSVLGHREVSGGTGTVLQGESGGNDPVGIALMLGLLAAGAITSKSMLHVGREFLIEMVVGTVLGIVGGLAMNWFNRAVRLPGLGLYPVRSIACVLLIFAATTLLHGSGFLAVFVAGILAAEAEAPYKKRIGQFHLAAASLGEIVAFVVLGLTVRLGDLTHLRVWWPGLLLAVALVLIRPIALLPCLIRSGLGRNERAFVMFAGLKGAVPILLGSYILETTVADASRLYGIVVVVVVFSVLVQGSLVPFAARRLSIEMSEPQH